MDASRAAIITSGEMDLFSIIHHQDEQNALAETVPSWALDPQIKYKHARVDSFPQSTYHASKDLPVLKISQLSSKILVAKGLFLDDIVEVGPLLPADTVVSWNALCHFARAGAVVAMCPHPPAASDFAFHTLSRTLVAGLTFSRQRVAFPVPSGATSLLRDLQADSADKDLKLVELEYQHVLVVACYMRRLFRTRDGLVGLGPELSRVGDVVAIFYKSDWPVVLRPTAKGHHNHHHFVGNCYVDETMDGEASTRFGEDPDRHRVFHLQ
jgi:hypothetical protein